MFVGLATFFCVWFPHLSEAAKDFGCDSLCISVCYALGSGNGVNIFMYGAFIFYFLKCEHSCVFFFFFFFGLREHFCVNYEY